MNVKAISRQSFAFSPIIIPSGYYFRGNYTMPGFKLTTIALLLGGLSHAQTRPFALLPASAAQSISHFCSRQGISGVRGSWHPTQTELERLESHLMRISRLKSEDELKRVQQPAGFYRQYIPIVVGGRKLIYVNAFSWTPTSYWRERIVDVCDTGPSGWGVLYDPRTAEFSHLRTNAVLVPPPPPSQ